jgi:hypothetical protein
LTPGYDGSTRGSGDAGNPGTLEQSNNGARFLSKKIRLLWLSSYPHHSGFTQTIFHSVPKRSIQVRNYLANLRREKIFLIVLTSSDSGNQKNKH